MCQLTPPTQLASRIKLNAHRMYKSYTNLMSKSPPSSHLASRIFSYIIHLQMQVT